MSTVPSPLQNHIPSTLAPTNATPITSVTGVERDPAIVVACVGTGSLHPIAQNPSALQQRTACAVPSTNVNVSPLRDTPPRRLQDQLLPPKYSPTDKIVLSVMDSTQVTLSGGFSIEKIVTRFESLWFTVENIPVTTERAAIERILAPFGGVKDIQFRDESHSNDFALTVITVQMATYPEVVRAINGLDGKEVFGQRVTAHLSLDKRITNRMLRDNYVSLSWPVPSITGYAGYDTLKAAQAAVAKADGKTVRNYWITASIYEGIPIIGAYNVRFSGLPPDAGAKFLNKFGRTEAIMLERPNYQAPKFGVPAVQRILQNFGKISQFQPVPSPYKDGVVRAWCLFESPDVARAACELHRVKQRSLGMERIFVRRVLSVLESVPRAKFDLVVQDLHHLRENVRNHIHGAHLAILPRHEAGDAVIRLAAEDSKTLARLRVELLEILGGEILKENGRQVWDDFLRGEAGSQFLDSLRASNPGVMISLHYFRRCIRLIGTDEHRKPVATAILAKLSSLRQHKVHSIPLDGQLIGVFVSPDLMAAQQRYGEENVRLDFHRQILRVRGTEALYEEVQQIVHTVKLRHTTQLNNDHCPVCLEPPLTPVFLGCGHRWCKACLVAYLSAASDTRSFPISCLGNQGRCTEPVPILLARRVLPPADFDALSLAAFHAHVQAYPTGPRNAVLSCPSCLARICPSCHVEYHEGVTCADREDGGDRLFQEWMRTHDVKKCPGCNAPIERAEGCNHMTCSRCHTHTCWVCLETFPKGNGIYDHMREFHGGIGL
ncbi:hypothetical protein B0F90DRAFT_1159513 [Multifurca ochricompacta]|uniref:Uncharacterized protein n=1 Tax=Multifurca ochricompacta TaxID=376703 RepID=A0AAD4M789_9AGAM|nr:hypothetical protein B0F90DRAFT_1159513 [Multifurca ochricompacta]